MKQIVGTSTNIFELKYGVLGTTRFDTRVKNNRITITIIREERIHVRNELQFFIQQ